MCVCAGVPVGLCPGRLKISLKVILPELFTGSPTRTCGSLTRSGWLASKPKPGQPAQGSSCLHVSNSGIAHHTYLHAQIRTQELGSNLDSSLFLCGKNITH